MKTNLTCILLVTLVTNWTDVKRVEELVGAKKTTIISRGQVSKQHSALVEWNGIRQTVVLSNEPAFLVTADRIEEPRTIVVFWTNPPPFKLWTNPPPFTRGWATTNLLSRSNATLLSQDKL